MTRSKFLEIVGSNEIGLYLFKQKLSPFLYKRLTLSICNAPGKIPVFKD